MASTPQTVRQLQRKLYCVSKQQEDYRFYSLYDKLYREDILQAAMLNAVPIEVRQGWMV